MRPTLSSTIDALAKFANLLATAGSSHDVEELLVQSAIDVGPAAGAVLIEIDAVPRIVATRAFDTDVVLSAELVGADLAKRVLDASNGRFASSAPLPLIGPGGLYGVLVLLFTTSAQLDDEAIKVLGAFVDMGATALARVKEMEELERAYQSLDDSRRALVQAEKLRALGAMAAGISHDLRNVFAPLLLVLEAIQGADADTMRKRVAMMRRPLDNGLKIVDRLRVFSRPPGVDLQEIISVDTIVGDAVGLCEMRLGDAAKRVEIKVELAPAPLVRVEAAEAVAAVTNLVINALDVIGAEGGCVTIRTGLRDGSVIIEVTDTGPGVPAEMVERIFEPFFTTKGKSGTGLGLSLVRDFVRNHGGTVQLDSPADGGARFTLTLPPARDPS